MTTTPATIIRADARHLPLPDASVDLIVTSPPYFALRSYTDGGQHYAAQIGAEPTPTAYIDSLIDCTREWMRVLKPSGSIWVNLGDKYAQSTERSRNGEGERQTEQTGGLTGAKSYLGGTVQFDRRGYGVAQKSLVGLPWRYALRCIDDLGLILRAEIIWAKPNSLPESVQDRVRRSHETWFHLVKQPRYYSAVDEIREPQTSGAHGAARAARRDKRAGDASRWPTRHEVTDYRADRDHKAMSPLGKLPGSVWEIATEPLTVPDHLGVDHFAAFPTEWPRRIILGWSPSGICTACGEGRRPVAVKAKVDVPGGSRMDRNNCRNNATPGREGRTLGRHAVVAEITGEVCACPDTTAPTRPAMVLDPFSGTGTTVLVASALGRHGIGVDRSADYCRLAQWRTTDPGQIAKAMRVPRPPAELDGQLDLLAATGGAA